MPALVVCGKPTCVAGDDLRVFTIFAVLLRLIQIVVLVPLTIRFATTTDFRVLSYDEKVCPELADNYDYPRLVQNSRFFLITYIVTSFVLAFTGLGIETGIWRNTSKGTPIQTELRWKLRPLCLCKMLPMSAFRLAVVCFGFCSVLLLTDVCRCKNEKDDSSSSLCIDREMYSAWLIILWCSHLVEAAAVAVYALYFLCKNKPQTPPLVSAQTKWNWCCKCCCTLCTFLTCCLMGGRDVTALDFSDVAVVLSDFFDDAGILDVVLSDIVVGLKLLARVQRRRQLECRKRVIERCSAMRLLLSAANSSSNSSRAYENTPIRGDEELGCGGKGLVEVANEKKNEGKNVDDDDDELFATCSEFSLQNDNNDHDIIIEPGLAELVLRDIDETDGPLNHTITSALSTLSDTNDDGDVDGNDEPQRNGRRLSVMYQLHRSGTVGFDFRPTERMLLSRKNEADLRTIAEGARFMRFARGAYTFRKVASYSVMPSSYLEWRQRRRLQRAVVKQQEQQHDGSNDDLAVMGDKLDQNRLRSVTGLAKCKIVYAQYNEGLTRTPYFIAIDYSWKAIVVSVRGTDCLDDVVADLALRPACLSEWGTRCGFDGSEYYVHAGILKCAEWIYNDLESHGLLDKLLLQNESSPVKGYDLRLTGHSLGAGIAACLGFLLKSKFQQLKCSCFSPPGCSISLNMAESSTNFITSYILDGDIIPRMSVESMKHLREDVAEMVARIKVTKHEAMNAKYSPGEEERLLHSRSSMPPSRLTQQIAELVERQEEVERAGDSLLRRPLYLPGQIVQLVKTGDDDAPTSCCCSRSSCTAEPKKKLPSAARWAQRDDFKEIQITSGFLDDHKSINVLSELERVAKLFGLSPPFVLQDDNSESNCVVDNAQQRIGRTP